MVCTYVRVGLVDYANLISFSSFVLSESIICSLKSELKDSASLFVCSVCVALIRRCVGANITNCAGLISFLRYVLSKSIVRPMTFAL